MKYYLSKSSTKDLEADVTLRCHLFQVPVLSLKMHGILWENRYVHYLDCGIATGVYICQKSSNCVP